MYRLLSICLILLCSFSASAQSNDAKSKDDDEGFSLPNGIRVGFQNSTLENSDLNAANHVHFGYIGYLRKIHLIPFLHLETGLEYMIAGAKQTEDSKLELHYIVLPAQGVFKIGPFVGLAGINADFRIAENYSINGQTVKRSGSDKSATFDLALDAGGGFNILFFTAEFRYYWGLLEVENGWYNRYWQAGLKFHF